MDLVCTAPRVLRARRCCSRCVRPCTCTVATSISPSLQARATAFARTRRWAWIHAKKLLLMFPKQEEDEQQVTNFQYHESSVRRRKIHASLARFTNSPFRNCQLPLRIRIFLTEQQDGHKSCSDKAMAPGMDGNRVESHNMADATGGTTLKHQFPGRLM